MTAWIVPLAVSGILLYGAARRVDIVSSFLTGAKEGLHTALAILPPLVLLLTVIGMLRASGGLDVLSGLLAPLFRLLGVPPETAPLALIRPLSGSGALAALEDALSAYGADSLAGRTAAVMMSSTETTFYTTAVYFGAVGVKRTRYAIPCALIGDLTGIIVSAWAVRLFFGC